LEQTIQEQARLIERLWGEIENPECLYRRVHPLPLKSLATRYADKCIEKRAAEARERQLVAAMTGALTRANSDMTTIAMWLSEPKDVKRFRQKAFTLACDSHYEVPSALSTPPAPSAPESKEAGL
jgi:hypothetical protein